MGKHADKIAALIADEKGKEIQCRLLHIEDTWSFMSSPSWNFNDAEYREKPFEPEVGKAYVFWSETEFTIPHVAILSRGKEDEDHSNYITVNGVSWNNCRPLTEEEIGK